MTIQHTDPDVASSPEFLQAQKAQAALEAKAQEIAEGKARRAAVVEEHRTKAAELEVLRHRHAQGVREVAALERLAQVKFAEAAATLGALDVRPGFASDRTRTGLELTATVAHLRTVLRDLDAEIEARAKSLVAFAKEHAI